MGHYETFKKQRRFTLDQIGDSMGLHLGGDRMRFLIGFVLLLAACAPSQKESNSKWYGSMHDLSLAMSEIIPLLHDANEFNDPRNFNLIYRNAEVIERQSHRVDLNTKPPDGDVTIRFVASEFSEQMRHAVASLKEGNRLSARYELQQVVHYCIQCHTRTSQGQQAFRLVLGDSFKKLPPLEQAEFYSATRDFDPALEAYDKALTDPGMARDQSWRWLQGLKGSLAIAVRVKRDPSLSLEMVSRLFDQESVPEQFKEDARGWRKVIKDWQRDELSQKAAPLSRSSRFKKADGLLTEGLSLRHPRFPVVNNSGFVHFLRASTLFHELLAEKVNDQYQSQALYKLGVVSESLGDVAALPSASLYYEACIMDAPKTALAKDCFYRYERQNLAEFVRGHLQGQAVPDHVRKKMDRLRSAAGL